MPETPPSDTTDAPTTDQPDTDADSTDDSDGESSGHLLTRRDALAAAASLVGAKTVASITQSGDAASRGSFSAGGGSMADPAAEYQTKLYTGTLDERPEPQIEDRYWAATDAKVLYRDTGDQWVVEGGLGSEQEPLPEIHSETVQADDTLTSSRLADVVVHQVDGEWHADGDDAIIASGSDPGTVIQTAVDSLTDSDSDAVDDGIIEVNGLDPSSVNISVDPQVSVIYKYRGSHYWESKNGQGLRYWGTGANNDYQDIHWYPERRGVDGTDADVKLGAHKRKAGGNLDQEFHVYVSDSGGTLQKRLKIGYGEDLAPVQWTDVGNYVIQSDELILDDPSGTGWARYFAGSNDEGIFKLNPRERAEGGGSIIQFFRDTNTTANPLLQVYKGDGSSEMSLYFDARSGAFVGGLQGGFDTGNTIWFMDGAQSPSGSGFGSTPEDLAGKTGNFDGEMRVDDGTNTPARGTMCVWDNANSVWRPSNSPSSGSFS